MVKKTGVVDEVGLTGMEQIIQGLAAMLAVLASVLRVGEIQWNVLNRRI